ncbi:hypothetical protein CPS_2287 [Colwellia psychrerythraea 34H]|uniref:Uncharacterized protein n=1 Tax=Colwellia psychrerythraea (strain 34H / ATCC BAA-681) TaxID=167879 RepID=Q482L0_COLP3|nr:hypothetical protein CPS_2287 [Colwellia psychrerythraea 34H]
MPDLIYKQRVFNYPPFNASLRQQSSYFVNDKL